ncbi:winged helix-turn-helix transcriptional regulator [Butyricicoccus sp. 1XD8-22]|nr:winged helix-turn-helix transcriptional regulator [Butyricicoccus sp. 1XD8-22]
MDEIGVKLLHLPQINAHAALKTLTQKVRMSSPAVSAQLERLERDGIIQGYTDKIDVQKLGYYILLFQQNLRVRICAFYRTYIAAFTLL